MKFLSFLLLALAVNSSFCMDVSKEEEKSDITSTEEFNAVIDENCCAIRVMKFFKPLCIDCQNLKPYWEALVEKYKIQDVQFYNINATTTETKKLAEQLGIKNYPTIIIFKNGQELNRKVEPSHEQLKEMIIDIIIK